MKVEDLFELAPNGYGCRCRACKKGFTTTSQFHMHLGTCAGNKNHRQKVQPEPPAEQLAFADAAGAWLTPKAAQ